jgi:hypothetical protein
MQANVNCLRRVGGGSGVTGGRRLGHGHLGSPLRLRVDTSVRAVAHNS